jgi:large subunit ribosomal protein L21
MYAVIKTGGKQYRVATDDVLTIEKIAGETGATVEFAEVLMLGGAGDPKVGAPAVLGAKVVAEVVEQGRAAKVIAFKKRRRKNSRRKRGHRQYQTTVRIKEIIGA